MLITGIFTAAIVSFLMGIINTSIVSCFIFILYAIPTAFMNTVPRSVVSKLVDEDVRGTAFGFYYIVIGILDLPASFIAGVLWENIGKGSPFYFASFLSILSIIIFAIFFREKK